MITTIPTTVGISVNMLVVTVFHPLVFSAATMLCVTLIAIAPNRPAINALITVLVKSIQPPASILFGVSLDFAAFYQLAVSSCLSSDTLSIGL